jgi:riboflavin kinase/FMN adenylyltransferase
MPAHPRRPALIPHRLDEVPPELAGGVVAIGNFDGVHRGHAMLLEAAVAEARKRQVPAVVLTFEPHPRTVFRPEAPVFRLTPLPEKSRLITALGLDGIAVIPFDRTFAALSAEEFVEAVLVGGLEASAVVIGHDFHFGKGRSGSPAMLAAEGKRLGFSVSVVPAVVDENGAPISSSVIREALVAGDILDANDLLGHRWFVTGEVIGGARRGRELGFPTANIRLSSDCRLRHGIYAVEFARPGGIRLGGVANYGRRPQFDNGAPLLEVFIFDFDGDLYGETPTVTFLDWVRPEERFPSVEALIGAMRRDTETARGMVARAGEGSALDRAVLALA